MSQAWLADTSGNSRLTRIQRETLEVIDDGVGVTVHDIAHAMGAPLWRCRLVVAELRRQGCLAYAGESSSELVITETGVDAYRNMGTNHVGDQGPESAAPQPSPDGQDTMSWADIVGQIRRKLNLPSPVSEPPATTKTPAFAKENETD